MRRFLFVLLILATTSTFAQIGGKKSFEFLNVPNNARLAALGGVNASLADRDLNFVFSNPALVSDSLKGFASAGYQFYVADVGQATFSYAHDFKKIGTLTFGVQHLNYGTLKAYDATGQEIGDYKSGETALVISKSHQISNFRLGANFKMAFSNLAGYRASAMMLDVGGVFVHPKKDLRVGLVIKNMGVVLSDYSNTGDAKLPFDIQLGVTFKPEHMPLRFSFTGYNHLVHQELKLENAGGGAGISFGFSARIKAMEFVFSRSAYVVGNAGYNFTLSADLNRFLKKK